MLKLGDNLVEKTEAVSGDEAGRVEDEDEEMVDDETNYVIEMEDPPQDHHEEELQGQNCFVFPNPT
jgi:hypothetical protein